tara:strand:- start:313040 stop:313849 length:810 start_codon:yes stop_codon:yes gene_type:complete
MVFISTSGALGRYVDLPVPVIIAIRAILAFFFLFLYCKWKGISLKVSSKDRLPVILSGLLIALHWLFYFYALKWSNVAIGMLALFTYPVITSFLEPLMLKTKLQMIHWFLGFLVLFGIYFLAPDFNMDSSYTLAVLMGLLSALAYALRNIILKTKVSTYNGSMLMCYQSAIAGCLLFPALYFTDFEVIITQWQGLVALGLITTAIGHTLFLNCFKHFSVTTVSILSSVQPVYGILIGAFFLSEIPSWSTVFGGVLILTSVVIESFRSYK